MWQTDAFYLTNSLFLVESSRCEAQILYSLEISWFVGFYMQDHFSASKINLPHLLSVEKDFQRRFIDCNDTWLRYANFKSKDQIVGLTDKDCVWAPFSHISESYEKEILTGKTYPLINPALAGKEGRFCWFHNFKWPKYDDKKNIVGLNVIAFEISDPSKTNTLNFFKNLNRFNVDHFAIDKPTKDDLTKREKEILFYLCYGLALEKISKILSISIRTVETHVENIKNKLNCSTKSQLIEYAVHKGYIHILPSALLAEEIFDKIF